jgi:arabinosaccharide transport system substrate-binding protein
MRFQFPFGAAALCILLMSFASGVWLALHPTESKKATLTMWTFAPTHYDAYKEAASSFEKAHPGVTVDIQLVTEQAVTSRLQAALWSDLEVPDLVEVPIHFAGSFFRGSLENIGFLDLTERVEKAGLLNRMVKARFAPYMSRNRIFGLPHDVHPVMLAYRRDIFEKEGIDASQIKTWDDFARVGHKLTIPNKRYMLELFDTRDAHLASLLTQRGGGYFDAAGNAIFDNEIAVRTMMWYVPLVAGKKRIANSLGAGQVLTKAVEDGYFVCLITPDWRTKTFEDTIPRAKGKMALMPLPAVEPGGRQTSTWGGTMLGITKGSRTQELAWQFSLHLYLDKAELGERFRGTNIIPAVRDAWDQPEFREPRAYWSGQPIGSLYAQLAPQTPYQYTSPYIAATRSKLGEALIECIQYYNANGEKGFEAFTRARLKKSADAVRALAQRSAR